MNSNTNTVEGGNPCHALVRPVLEWTGRPYLTQAERVMHWRDTVRKLLALGEGPMAQMVCRQGRVWDREFFGRRERANGANGVNAGGLWV